MKFHRIFELATQHLVDTTRTSQGTENPCQHLSLNSFMNFSKIFHRSKPIQLFGGNLDDIMKHSSHSQEYVPLVLRHIFEKLYLDTHYQKGKDGEDIGLYSNGIFRQCGSVDCMDKYIKGYELGKFQNHNPFLHERNVHVIGSLMKKFLRELVHPLFSKESFEMLAQVFQYFPQDDNLHLFVISECIQNNCTSNQQNILNLLTYLLHWTSILNDWMKTRQLSIIFGQVFFEQDGIHDFKNVVIKNQIVATLIDNYSVLFNREEDYLRALFPDDFESFPIPVHQTSYLNGTKKPRGHKLLQFERKSFHIDDLVLPKRMNVALTSQSISEKEKLFIDNISRKQSLHRFEKIKKHRSSRTEGLKQTKRKSQSMHHEKPQSKLERLKVNTKSKTRVSLSKLIAEKRRASWIKNRQSQSLNDIQEQSAEKRQSLLAEKRRSLTKSYTSDFNPIFEPISPGEAMIDHSDTSFTLSSPCPRYSREMTDSMETTLYKPNLHIDVSRKSMQFTIEPDYGNTPLLSPVSEVDYSPNENSIIELDVTPQEWDQSFHSSDASFL